MPRSWFLLIPLFVFASIAAAEVPVAPLESVAAPGFQRYPDVARDGDGYFAVWTDDREASSREIAYGARLNARGELLDPAGIRLFESVGQLAVACGDGRCVVIDGALQYVVVEDGAVIARGAIADVTGLRIHVVYNGREFFVFYGYDTVHAAAIDRDGRVVVPRYVVIDYVYGVHPEAVAFNGSRFVMLYTRDDQLWRAVLDANGKVIADAVLDTDVIWSSVPGPTTASIRTDGGEFVAVWRRWLTGEYVAARFDAEGARVGEVVSVATDLGQGFTLGAEALYAVSVDASEVVAVPIARDLTIGARRRAFAHPTLSISSLAAADDLLLVERFHRNLPSQESELFAVRGVESPQLVTRAAPSQESPRIAVGESGTLVAWNENRGSGELPHFQLHASFIARDGSAHAFAVAPSTLSQQVTSVAALGDAFLVVWLEGGGARARVVRGGATAGPVITLTEHGSALAAGNGRDFVVVLAESAGTAYSLLRLSRSGEIVQRGEEFSANAALGINPSALACGNDGECMFLWRDLLTKPPCFHFGCPFEERVLAHRITPDLALRDAAPIELAPANWPTAWALALAAAGDGSYAAAWTISSGVAFRTIDATGALGDVFTRKGQLPAIAREGDAWLLLRGVESAGRLELVGTRFTRTLATSDLAFLRDRQSRSRVSLARDGARVLAAYQRTTRDEAAGGVPRVWLEVLEPPAPKRRAVR